MVTNEEDGLEVVDEAEDGAGYLLLARAADRQVDKRFKTKEAELERQCENNNVTYKRPLPTEASCVGTTKRRRRLRKAMIPNMSKEECAIAAAKRQSHKRFVTTESNMKAQCDATRGVMSTFIGRTSFNFLRLASASGVMLEVMYEAPPPDELEGGADLRSKMLRRKLKGFNDWHRYVAIEFQLEVDCNVTSESLFQVIYEPPTLEELRAPIEREIRRTRLRRGLKAHRKWQEMMVNGPSQYTRNRRGELVQAMTSYSSRRMLIALKAFEVAKEEDHYLTLNDPYPGKPPPGRDCPCRQENQGYLTVTRIWRWISKKHDKNLESELLLGWGICHGCVEPYVADLGEALWYLTGGFLNGFLSPPAWSLLQCTEYTLAVGQSTCTCCV